MTIMTFERIKHDACKAVFEGTEYKWINQMDNTEEVDREAKRKCGDDEEKLFAFWAEYFNELLVANRWSDRQ